jgi:hypothetical protein
MSRPLAESAAALAKLSPQSNVRFLAVNCAPFFTSAERSARRRSGEQRMRRSTLTRISTCRRRDAQSPTDERRFMKVTLAITRVAPHDACKRRSCRDWQDICLKLTHRLHSHCRLRLVPLLSRASRRSSRVATANNLTPNTVRCAADGESLGFTKKRASARQAELQTIAWHQAYLASPMYSDQSKLETYF